jgi:protease-4
VAKGRGIERTDVEKIAQGRVWSGRDAIGLKLVNALGGLDDATKHAAKLANIEDDYCIDTPDAPKSPFERFLDSLSGADKRKMTKTGLFNEAKNEWELALRQLRSLNDPNGVYALAPVVIIK